MGDGSAQIMPVAVGVIFFVVVLTFVLTIDDFQETTVISPGEVTEKISNDPSALLGTQYIDWSPESGYSFNNTSTYILSSYYSWYGAADSRYVQFTDPNYDNHFLDVRIIRGNTLHQAAAEGDQYAVIHALFEDYISFDFYIEDWGIHHGGAMGAVSFDNIIYNQIPDQNFSVFSCGEYNISGFIVTPGNSTTFSTDLYMNNYTLHIVQNPQINHQDFLSVLWWIISFNSAWMPDAPFFAYIISFLVDALLAMMIVFVVQGFIP